MGPSGSGKSTLLYNIAGMDNPSSGLVWLGTTEITSMTKDEKADVRLHKTGFVFQQMNMMKDLNIKEYILLPAIQANKGKNGKNKKELAQRAAMLMNKLDISGIGERSITQVSGGQLQRACICRSMMNEPMKLFADEPTGALNKSTAAEVMAEFEKLNNEGTTILMVTHDSKVASVCSRVMYLLDGKIYGEIILGKAKKEEERQREEKLNSWLSEIGW